MKKLTSINKWILVLMLILPLLLSILIYFLLQIKVERTYSGELISNKESQAEFVLKSNNATKFKVGKNINFYIEKKLYQSKITYATIKEDGKIHIRLNKIDFDILKNQVIPAKVIYSSQTLWNSIVNNSL